MEMPSLRALGAFAAAVAAAAGVVGWQLALGGGAGGTPLQRGSAPMPSHERLGRLAASLIEEAGLLPQETGDERLTVVPTTWQAVDRFVTGERFARGCRARNARGSSTSPSLEPVYALSSTASASAPCTAEEASTSAAPRRSSWSSAAASRRARRRRR